MYNMHNAIHAAEWLQNVYFFVRARRREHVRVCSRTLKSMYSACGGTCDIDAGRIDEIRRIEWPEWMLLASQVDCVEGMETRTVAMHSMPRELYFRDMKATIS